MSSPRQKTDNAFLQILQKALPTYLRRLIFSFTISCFCYCELIDLFAEYHIVHIQQRYLKCLLPIVLSLFLYHHAVSASMLTRKIISDLPQNRNRWNNNPSQYVVGVLKKNKALPLLTIIAEYLWESSLRNRN